MKSQKNLIKKFKKVCEKICDKENNLNTSLKKFPNKVNDN